MVNHELRFDGKVSILKLSEIIRLRIDKY